MDKILRFKAIAFSIRDIKIINLTEGEKQILIASTNTEFGSALEDKFPWTWSVIDNSGLEPKIARGVISSLIKKGLVHIVDYPDRRNPDDFIFSLSDTGKKITQQLLKDI
ncbi:hypothetical protein PCC7424_5514 (plasmid) [Gloeothece citriformis PCC 7424]|uniref:MarR family transcriptional regulator n=1 Tax=Gloeothece citriformis (strain PCC 7424) TaxID=65393 RepID=B7KMR0_GLOC7|nr:hypothetical protein [Gloeothece citriformis]ACK74082.1 hypothetical protein PCC7424_5514 [Gloeothece citriformis PCC 7424]